MVKYAGSSDLIISRVNGESMSRFIPNGSLIAIHKVNTIYDIKDDDIVVFQGCGDIAIKRFYNNSFGPMSYSYNDLANIKIIGKVIVYIVLI